MVKNKTTVRSLKQNNHFVTYCVFNSVKNLLHNKYLYIHQHNNIFTESILDHFSSIIRLKIIYFISLLYLEIILCL